MSREYADPNCPECKGHGFIYGASMLDGGRFCDCTLNYRRLGNMDRVWSGLRKAKEIPGLREKPPLVGLTKRNLWLTASQPAFRAHLKAVCFNKATLWDARVYSDKDLLSAWLNTARAQGHEIFDSELRQLTVSAMDIDELVEPPDLVILITGIKHTPNKEAQNALLEALSCRRHLDRPTWVVDQPDHPLDDPAHRFYSETLEGILAHWAHLRISGPNIKIVGGPEYEEKPIHPVADTNVEEIIDTRAEKEVDEALADLDEDEEDEEDEEEEDEEAAAEEDPLVAALMEAEEKAEKKQRKKKYQRRKRGPK